MPKLAPLLVIFSLFGASDAPAQENRVLRMGTGNLAGVYFPVGVAVCRVLNSSRQSHGIRCAAVPTRGSNENVQKLKDGEIELAIVQSDIQSDAYHGSGLPEYSDLRALFSLHSEPMTIVARADSGIASIADLPGHAISVGNPGSGHRAIWDLVMEEMQWAESDFPDLLELEPADQSEMLCDGTVDAFVMAVGHPALTVQEATLSCDAVLVSALSEQFSTRIEESSTYFKTEIPGGIYRGNPDPVPTFGVLATLVTDKNVAEGEIATLVENVFDGLGDLRGFDPVLADLEARAMVQNGLTAPFHPAAEDYYSDSSLLPK